jgi:acetyl esterase/lipase
MKQTGFALTLLLATAIPCRAGDKPLVLNVWPGAAPGVKSPVDDGKPVAEEKMEEVKPGKQSFKRVSNVSKPTITVYRAPHDHDTGAAVVICPGGGYQMLAWDYEGVDVATWLNSIGVTGIVLKYRVPRPAGSTPGTQPVGPLQDAQRALSLVRSKAGEWGIDPNRIGILGFSAGGHLATSASCNFDKRAYEAVDDVDKISCRPDFAVLVYPAYLLAAGKSELAPEIRLRKECPPTIIIHAGDDKLVRVDGSIQAYLALVHAGVPTELHVYTTGGHGFGMRPGNRPSASWPQRCGEWLRSQGFLTKAVAGN